MRRSVSLENSFSALKNTHWTIFNGLFKKEANDFKFTRGIEAKLSCCVSELSGMLSVWKRQCSSSLRMNRRVKVIVNGLINNRLDIEAFIGVQPLAIVSIRKKLYRVYCFSSSSLMFQTTISCRKPLPLSVLSMWSSEPFHPRVLSRLLSSDFSTLFSRKSIKSSPNDDIKWCPFYFSFHEDESKISKRSKVLSQNNNKEIKNKFF